MPARMLDPLAAEKKFFARGDDRKGHLEASHVWLNTSSLSKNEIRRQNSPEYGFLISSDASQFLPVYCLGPHETFATLRQVFSRLGPSQRVWGSTGGPGGAGGARGRVPGLCECKMRPGEWLEGPLGEVQRGWKPPKAVWRHFVHHFHPQQ